MPLSKLHYSYKAAKLAINSLFGEEHMAVYDELDLELLLGNITGDVKEYFLEKTIQVFKGNLRTIVSA